MSNPQFALLLAGIYGAVFGGFTVYRTVTGPQTGDACDKQQEGRVLVDPTTEKRFVCVGGKLDQIMQVVSEGSICDEVHATCGKAAQCLNGRCLPNPCTSDKQCTGNRHCEQGMCKKFNQK